MNMMYVTSRTVKATNAIMLNSTPRIRRGLGASNLVLVFPRLPSTKIFLVKALCSQLLIFSPQAYPFCIPPPCSAGAKQISQRFWRQLTLLGLTKQESLQLASVGLFQCNFCLREYV